MNIITKSIQQIDKIRTTLKDIEIIVIRYIEKNNLIAAFKNYNGFPWYLCTSLNDCLVHGIPDRTIIKTGDLLKIDIGINYRWAISDAAFSIIVWWWASNPEGQHIIDVSKWALDEGLKSVRTGNFIASFGESVSDYVYSHGCSVIKDLNLLLQELLKNILKTRLINEISIRVMVIWVLNENIQ